MINLHMQYTHVIVERGGSLASIGGTTNEGGKETKTGQHQSRPRFLPQTQNEEEGLLYIKYKLYLLEC